VLNHLYVHPLVTPNGVASLVNVTHQTASTLIRDFERLDILKKFLKVGRRQAYLFERYLALFLDRDQPSVSSP
jgi:hypothetical protein